jgi:hypothetical protein
MGVNHQLCPTTLQRPIYLSLEVYKIAVVGHTLLFDLASGEHYIN